MFQRILLAWDGSNAALRAFDVAIDLTRRYEGELVAVSIAYSPARAETKADRVESAEAARRHLHETFTAVRDRADRAGVPVDHEIIGGARAGRLLLRGIAQDLIARATIPSSSSANSTDERDPALLEVSH